MNRQCELCENPANMYCDSDRASLCWDCDKKVHGANFIVAKHSRTLLCHACRNPTPWRGSGVNLVPALSICGGCVKGYDRAESRTELGEENEGVDVYNNSISDYDSDDDDDGHDQELEVDEEENQVVPWGSMSSPRDVVSRSSSEDDDDDDDESSDRGYSDCGGSASVVSRKRPRSHGKTAGARRLYRQMTFQLDQKGGGEQRVRLREGTQEIRGRDCSEKESYEDIIEPVKTSPTSAARVRWAHFLDYIRRGRWSSSTTVI